MLVYPDEDDIPKQGNEVPNEIFKQLDTYYGYMNGQYIIKSVLEIPYTDEARKCFDNDINMRKSGCYFANVVADVVNYFY